MKSKFLGSVAVALGLGLAGSASAQYAGYPAGGYSNGSQASIVPVHPNLQQPPRQSQWPMNGVPAAGQWSGGQPGFAVAPAPAYPGYARQQAQYAAQPRQLPPVFHTVSTQNPQSGEPTPANPSGPAAEVLPDSANQPNGYAPPSDAYVPQSNGYLPQSSVVDGNGAYGDHYSSGPAPPASYAQPHYGQPTPFAGGDCGSCNVSPFTSHGSNSFGSHLSNLLPIGKGLHGGCGPQGCGPAPAPISYGPAPLRNWFGGANLLFLTTEENCDRRLVFDVGYGIPTLLSTGDVDPSGDVGFDVFFGRYFNCGRHALMVNYFLFDPDGETQGARQPGAGVGPAGNPYDYRAWMPSWNNISYDVGLDGDPTNDVSLYQQYDNSIGFRVRRNVAFQGIEANLVCFGLGGASRGAIGPIAGPCQTGCGPKPGCAGPMIPGCGDKLQIRTTHGLRWFQFRDSFDFAASQTDFVYGTTTDDLYYNLDTENNLYGYQFGARLDYALGCKLNVYAGSKFGIFANDAQFRSRLGTTDTPGYVNSYYPTIEGTAVATDESDTVLSTLGELDLGLGYRLNCCWTVTGGYRLYGMTGVATTVGSISDDLAHLPSAGRVCADDSIFLHGGYVGVTYNW